MSGVTSPAVRLTLNRAILFTVLTALIPIATFSIIQGLAGREYARQLIAERLVTSALATMRVQREPFEAAQRTLAMLARDRDVVAMTDNCTEVLRRSLAMQRSIINLARVDAKGFVQCAALPYQKPLNNGRPPHWYRAAAEHRLTLGPPSVGKITKRRGIGAFLPLYDTQGTFAGAVAAAIDASWIERAIDRQRLSRNAVVVLADQKGLVHLSGKSSLGFKPDLNDSFGKAVSASAADGSKWMYSSAPLFEDQLYIVYAEPQRPLLSASSDQLRINLLLPILTILLTVGSPGTELEFAL